MADCKTTLKHLFTNETRIVDSGHDNPFKKKLSKYLLRYDNELTTVVNSIKVLRHLIVNQKRLALLYKYANSFTTVTWYSIWFSTIVLLCSMLKTKSDGSIFGLLDYIQKNQGTIFTKQWQNAEVPLNEPYNKEDIIWETEENPNVDEVVVECKQKLDEIAEDITSLFFVRDKVYAHFDEKSFDDEYRLGLMRNINIGLLERVSEVVVTVLNVVHHLYERKTVFYEVIGSDDITNIFEALEYHEAHIDEAFEWRWQMMREKANVPE